MNRLENHKILTKNERIEELNFFYEQKEAKKKFNTIAIELNLK